MSNLFDLEDFKLNIRVVKSDSGKGGVRMHVEFDGYLQEVIDKEISNETDTEEVRTGQEGY